MKVSFVKMPGGILTPASEIESERLNRFKNGIVYEVEIKGGERRNRGFHGKVFAFMNHCFEYWCANNTDVQYQVEAAQFNYFRENLTIKAGYYDVVSDLDGNTTVKARSLSFDSMDQETFEQFYNAIINAALATVFQGADSETCNRLYSFF